MALSSNKRPGMQFIKKPLLITLTVFLCIAVYGQDYPFAKDFTIGRITLRDGTQKLGYMKWFPAQEEKLIFRENSDGEKRKYKPEELQGFTSDTMKFISLSNFEVYAADYALLGNKSNVKHSFGQLLDSGKFNIYLVYFSAYNALSGSMLSYPNILFEKKSDSGFLYAAYPVDIRMTDKKYEKAKEGLYLFFNGYPEIVEKIRLYKKQDSFFGVIDFIKNLN